jgi:hypothetical protein
MPRKARINAPGALHHIICWGIEKTRIFRDGADRDSFVESVLAEQNERLARCHHLQAQGVDLNKDTDRVATIFCLKPNQVLSSVKQPQRGKARSLLCFWAVKELEMSGADVAQKLKVSNSAVSRSVARGEKIVADMKLNLIEY